ncbi:MAG: hypothetical protein KGH89_08320 [Thaumarchaeota archaeon]|nr:hypothetical protein [Nitrososphaerota archaeon]MDE1866760.1 hypothetical protein [Nitrososphaerota archaeon]
MENDLAAYSSQASLPTCTVTNNCLEIATPFGIPNSNLLSTSDVLFYVEQAPSGIT